MKDGDVTQALLFDGWHHVDRATYREKPSPGGAPMFIFLERGRAIEGPLSSILATRA